MGEAVRPVQFIWQCFHNWAMLALHLGASSPSAQESPFFSIHFSKNFGCTFLSRLWCVFRFLAKDGPLFNEITGLSAIFHDRQANDGPLERMACSDTTTGGVA